MSDIPYCVVTVAVVVFALFILCVWQSRQCPAKK